MVVTAAAKNASVGKETLARERDALWRGLIAQIRQLVDVRLWLWVPALRADALRGMTFRARRGQGGAGLRNLKVSGKL